DGYRPDDLRTRANDNVIFQRRVAFTALSVGRVCAAERDTLIDRDVVADLGSLTDHGESMIDEQVTADLRARVDIDGRQPAAQMIDQPRQKIELTSEQPVRNAMKRKRPDAGVEEDFRSRARRGVASTDGVQIGNQPIEHAERISQNRPYSKAPA